MELKVQKRVPRTVTTRRSVSLSISDVDTDSDAEEIAVALKKEVPKIVNKVTGQTVLVPHEKKKKGED